MKKNPETVSQPRPKAPYVKPAVIVHGSVEVQTLNSTQGGDPEGENDNIVWGN